MQSVLNKRIWRDLKENKFRYAALFLLIILCMYIVISVVGAAETVINGTARFAEQNKVEDGQFGVFIPLTDEQKNRIAEEGVALEEKFSMDVEAENGTVVRLMRNRENINLIQLDSGKLADNNGEIVLEKRYCSENNIPVGDTIEIAGIGFKVTGIGSTPDYDLPIKNISDISAESSGFGLGYITSQQYEKIKGEISIKAEDLCYAYRLNGKMTDDELKNMIKDFSFDYNSVEDEFFKETIDDTIGKKEDFQDGIRELNDGAEELENGVTELDGSSKALNDGASQMFDVFLAQANSALAQSNINETLTQENYGELLDKYFSLTQSADLVSLKQSLDAAKEYCEGVAEYTGGVAEVKDGSVELASGVGELKEETDKLLDEIFDYDIDNLTLFVKAEDNLRINAAADDVIVHKEVGIIAGAVVIALFAYVISVFVVHQIQRESSVIGTLYAMGVRKRSLILNYILLPAIICFAGGLIGLALSFSDIGVKYQMAETYSYFSVPDFEPSLPVYLVIYSVIMPAVIAVLVNFIIINKKLSRTALSLIRNEQKTAKGRNISLKNMGFIRSFQIRQLLREMRTGLTVIIAMVISLLILMLAVDCGVLCSHIQTQNKADTRYEYMYSLKYQPNDVPEGGEPVFSKSLSKTALGETLDINIMGIENDDKYFNVNTVGGKSNIVIGSSVAQRYGLEVGDKLILSDSANDMDYAFTVKDIAEYSVGLTVFMDIDSMRELFGEEDEYYNILLSDKELDIEEGRIYSVTTKEDVERSADVFVDLLAPMVTMMTTVSVIIFCIVMYMMMNVMIDRSSMGISLIKIFGYRTREIRKLYLNGNLLIVLVGAIIAIPVSKYLMDAIFPTFIANVACGIDLRFEWYMYAVIFAGILALYFLINAILVRKIKKITPAEVLKNRE